MFTFITSPVKTTKKNLQTVSTLAIGTHFMTYQTLRFYLTLSLLYSCAHTAYSALYWKCVNESKEKLFGHITKLLILRIGNIQKSFFWCHTCKQELVQAQFELIKWSVSVTEGRVKKAFWKARGLSLLTALKSSERLTQYTGKRKWAGRNFSCLKFLNGTALLHYVMKPPYTAPPPHYSVIFWYKRTAVFLEVSLFETEWNFFRQIFLEKS